MNQSKKYYVAYCSVCSEPFTRETYDDAILSKKLCNNCRDSINGESKHPNQTYGT